MMTHPTDTPPAAPADPTDRAAQHWLTVVPLLDTHRPVLIFTCGAGECAACRLVPGCVAAGLCDGIHHGDTCRRGLVDGGWCLAAQWLNDLTYDDLTDACTAPPGAPRSAPVTVTWEDGDWTWDYDTPNDTGAGS